MYHDSLPTLFDGMQYAQHVWTSEPHQSAHVSSQHLYYCIFLLRSQHLAGASLVEHENRRRLCRKQTNKHH